ncbi:MAG: flippase-like domain-containing protein [Tannerellaceae bacterium]|jgi:hypothetical protein|nr:flippase-like domain-containing protein [Tannerellaceae bacterium]
MKKCLQILLIVSIVVCFFIFLKATDTGASFRLIRQLGFYVVFIPAITCLAGLAGASGWKCCIGSGAKPSLTRLFMIRQTGNTVTMFNPVGAIAGELFNARMLIREGVEAQEAYKSVVLMHTLMILSQFLLLVVVFVQFLFFHSDELSPGMMLAVHVCFPALLFAVLGLAFLLLRKGRETKTDLKEKNSHKIISRIEEMRFLLATHVRIHPGKTVAAFFLFSAHWILGSLELFFILYFLNNPVNIWDSLFLDTLIIVLKSTAAFIPGQLGAEELINRFVLHLPGISSPDLWLPVSILRRARQLFWSGMALLFYAGLKGGKKSIKGYGDIVRQS